MKKTIQGHRLLFKAIVGSQAYGTSTPTSDIDYKGIYLQNIDEIAMGKYKEQITVTDDEVYYELRRFLELLAKNNPTIIEMLNIPEDCIEYKDPILNEIFANRDNFLSKLCKKSFGGMVKSQLGKARGLKKKMNWSEEDKKRKGILDFCFVCIPSFNGSMTIPQVCEYLDIEQSQFGLTKLPHMFDCYQIYIDHQNKGWAHGLVSEEGNESNQLRLSSIPKGIPSVGVLNFNMNAYKHHCKKHAEWLKWDKNKNEQRYVEINEHGQSYDGKNMLHCRRILSMGLEIAQGKGVIVRRPDAEGLLKIRKGDINLKQLWEKSELDLKSMDSVFESSDLPDVVDSTLLDEMLWKLREYQLMDFVSGKMASLMFSQTIPD